MGNPLGFPYLLGKERIRQNLNVDSIALYIVPSVIYPIPGCIIVLQE